MALIKNFTIICNGVEIANTRNKEVSLSVTEQGSYSFKVTANPTVEAALKASSCEGTFTITLVNDISDLQFNNTKNEISWHDPKSNGSYLVKIDNNSEQTTSKTSIEYILVSGSHTIKVKKLGNGSEIFDSQFIELNITKLTAPANVHMQGRTVVWNPVENANGYIIYCNNNEIGRSVGSQTSYKLPEGISGELEITVCATGNGVTTFNSPLSLPIYPSFL